jgi:hypothetical protein
VSILSDSGAPDQPSVTPGGEALGPTLPPATPDDAARFAHVAAIQAELNYPRETPWAWVGSESLIAPAASSVPLRLIGHHPMLVRPSAVGSLAVGPSVVDVDWSLTSDNAAPELAARWPGYRFELFGFLLYINQHQLQYEAPNPPTTGACWRMYSPANGQTWLAVHIWLQRAYYGENPAAWAEVTWRPGWPATHGGIQYDRRRPMSRRDKDRADEGLELLEFLAPRVQTKPAETPEDAWQRLLKAGREACAQWDMDPEQLTHAQLAQAMNRRARAGRGGRVTDVLARAGRPLNDLKHALEAERREKLEKLQGDMGDDC